MYYIYVDEAWRWPIAWPVYVGIVVEKAKKNIMRWWDDLDALPWMEKNSYSIYDDSKVIAEDKREALYDGILLDKNISFDSWSAKSTEVDNKGIVRSIRTAIARAMRSFFHTEKFSQKKFLDRMKSVHSNIIIVVDGKTDFHMSKLWWISVIPIVDGDAKIPMISAASIVAKVERDREMRKHHKKYPDYWFDTHKWYGTNKHYQMIEEYGLCPIHRVSFLKSLD